MQPWCTIAVAIAIAIAAVAAATARLVEGDGPPWPLLAKERNELFYIVSLCKLLFVYQPVNVANVNKWRAIEKRIRSGGTSYDC